MGEGIVEIGGGKEGLDTNAGGGKGGSSIA
jgi:hypothetical protein